MMYHFEKRQYDETDLILSNNAGVLVDLPPGSKRIGCKRIFRRKYNKERTIQTSKARLVAKVFKQKERIYYFNTYAPVTRITSIKVLVTLTSILIYMYIKCILK